MNPSKEGLRCKEVGQRSDAETIRWWDTKEADGTLGHHLLDCAECRARWCLIRDADLPPPFPPAPAPSADLVRKIVALTASTSAVAASNTNTTDGMSSRPRKLGGFEIRAARVAARMTRIGLAHRLKIDERRVFEWEEGLAAPSETEQRLLAKVLGLHG